MTVDSELDRLAALSDPETLRLGRPLDARPLAVPNRIWLDGSKLRWRNDVAGFAGISDPKVLPEEERLVRFGAPHFVSSSPTVLDEFLTLADASDEAIKAFAERWGVLGICEHGLPHSHQPFTSWNEHLREITAPEIVGEPPGGHGPCMVSGTFELVRQWCRPLGWSDPPHEPHHRSGWEPLKAWKVFSLEARTVLNAAVALHGSPDGWAEVSDEDVETLWPGTNGAECERSGFQAIDWRWVKTPVNRWIGLGDVRPYLSAPLADRAITVRLGTTDSTTKDDLWFRSDGFFFEMKCGLFGALAAQLLFVATGQAGAAFCVECRTFFRPQRKPRGDQRSFCPECRSNGVPQKYAARDSRAAKRRAKQKA